MRWCKLAQSNQMQMMTFLCPDTLIMGLLKAQVMLNIARLQASVIVD